MNKRKKMMIVYHLPGVIGIIRVLLTLYVFIFNGFGMPLRFFQLIPLIALAVALFMYYKMYSDGVPVITLITPTLLHAVVTYIFRRVLVIIPFLSVLVIDIAFIVCKSLKANLYPFDIEGADISDELMSVEGIIGDAE